MEKAKKLIAEKVFADARGIIISGLSGIRARPSFDIGLVDYRIDNVDTRIEKITCSIVDLMFDTILSSEIREIIEEQVRNEIRNRI